MPFVYFGHILHAAVTNLRSVSAENFKMTLDQLKKIN